MCLCHKKLTFVLDGVLDCVISIFRRDLDEKWSLTKVKFTLEQGTNAQTGSILFPQPRRTDGVVVNATPLSLYPREWPGTHCIGGWVGPQDRSGRVRNLLPPPGFDPRTFQHVASRYTDWAIPAPNMAALMAWNLCTHITSLLNFMQLWPDGRNDRNWLPLME